jgi:hypothetical protein
MAIPPRHPELLRISQLETENCALRARLAEFSLAQIPFSMDAAHERVLKGSAADFHIQSNCFQPLNLTFYCTRLQAPGRRTATPYFFCSCRRF